VREGRLYNIDVYIDSPLAEEATKAYLAHPECFDEEAKRLLDTRASGDAIKLHFTRSVEDGSVKSSV
jgi:metallo-beta-lactamase family protein